jgi:hypothetical protein
MTSSTFETIVLGNEGKDFFLRPAGCAEADVADQHGADYFLNVEGVWMGLPVLAQPS